MRARRCQWRYGAVLALASMSLCAFGAHAQPTGLSWPLPTAPDTTPLDTKFPQCDLNNLETTNKCLIDLEFYRQQTLETDYHLGVVRIYSRDLERMSTRLESAHKGGKISLDDYQTVHDALSGALHDANDSDGRYLQTYANHLQKYKETVKAAKDRQWDIVHGE